MSLGYLCVYVHCVIVYQLVVFSKDHFSSLTLPFRLSNLKVININRQDFFHISITNSIQSFYFSSFSKRKNSLQIIEEKKTQHIRLVLMLDYISAED
jgi:hypothetical protein